MLPPPYRTRTLHAMSQALGAAVMLVGLLVLIGWALDIAVLKSLRPDFVTMKPNAALCFLLSGGALWLTSSPQRPWRRRLVMSSATLVLGLGLLTLFEYAAAVNLGIDELLFEEAAATTGTSSPGRMAPNTAMGFMLVSTALLLLYEPHRPVLGQLLAIVTWLIACLGLIGYLYNVEALYGVALYTEMAFHTALSLFLLASGLMFVRPRAGLMEIVGSTSIGGFMARRMFPLVLLTPMALGWVTNLGQARGYYESEYGEALFTIACIVIFALIVWWNARSLHLSDAGRHQAEAEVRLLNRDLELRVQLRTAELELANSRLSDEIQERRRIEQALVQSNQELQDFAYIASHDLQAPLRKIASFADLLDADYGEHLEGRGQQYLDRIRNAAQRMSQFIHDLLSFSRVATHAQAWDTVNLNEVVLETLSDLEAILNDTGGCVDVGTLPVIEAEPLQMRQLFQNLIGNALKFHRPDVPPHVVVSCRPEQIDDRDGYRIEVRDNGIGFDMTYLDRIFAPFQRLHGGNTYPGTGMGLAICRRIIERHNGVLSAEGNPDQGATFFVILPTKQDDELKPEEEAETEKEG